MASGKILRAIACFLCIGLLVCLALENGGGARAALAPSSRTTTTAAAAATTDAQVKLDPLHEIKRKVPNGPDPIHNRRAGKSGWPPGKA